MSTATSATEKISSVVTSTLHSVATTAIQLISQSIHNSTVSPYPLASHGLDPHNPTATAETEGEHFIFIQAFVMLSLILIALNINRFLHSIKFHFLSETAVYIILGFVAAIAWNAISYDEENKTIQLNSKFFYLVLLPPIIFEGGFNIQRVSFFSNIVVILSLAFAGALFATFTTAILMWGFSFAIDGKLSFISALVFGSLISSTDPVTVLSLLPSNCDRRLYMLIFGESALNDAVSIILYRFFTSLSESDLGVAPFFLSVVASAGVFIGSVIVGVSMALIFAKITKHINLVGDEGATFEGVMLLIFAYSSYLLAEILQLTGIISIFFCGIAMAHYAYNNLAPDTVKTMKVTIRILSFMMECFIFIYLGLGLLSFNDQAIFDPLYIICACFAILVSRTHVFAILGAANWISKKDAKIPFKNMVLIWFSGLRGAVAFALGVTFLELPNFSAEVKGIIFGTTVIVIVLTIIILGGLTPYMLVWLKITTPEENGHGNEGGDEKEHSSTIEDDYELAAKTVNKPIFGWLYRMDATYVRPFFTDLSKDRVAQIVRKLSHTATTLDFMPLKDLGGTGNYKSTESARVVQAEDVMLEAVSLN